jgi:hypothetical protein
MIFDWKFYATMLAAIAGILVPIWLWQADLAAHSLSVRLASSVALQPAETTSIPDIQISINGVNIKSPFLSTLELSNDGSKPIPTSDFESPVELSVGKDTQIVRARLTTAEPNNLKAELDTNKQSVKLRPLLLNPNDTLTIAIITSGSPPSFAAQARIAGISKIKFDDTTTKKASLSEVVKFSVIAFVSFVLYWIYGAFVMRSPTLRLGPVLSTITMLACGLLSSFALHKTGIDFDLGKASSWPFAFFLLAVGVSTLLYTLRRLKR